MRGKCLVSAFLEHSHLPLQISRRQRYRIEKCYNRIATFYTLLDFLRLPQVIDQWKTRYIY
jgi:hypothetical protein